MLFNDVNNFCKGFGPNQKYGTFFEELFWPFGFKSINI